VFSRYYSRITQHKVLKYLKKLCLLLILVQNFKQLFWHKPLYLAFDEDTFTAANFDALQFVLLQADNILYQESTATSRKLYFERKDTSICRWMHA
jgi:hypothetical protein